MTEFFLNELFHGSQHTLYKTDVKANEDGYDVHVLLPGFKKEEIDVTVEGNDLVVLAQTERSLPKFLYNRVKKTFGITGLSRDSLKAKLEDGLLTISLEKVKESVGRKIVIS